MTNLPLLQGYNAIMTVVERLTKYTRFIPCTIGDNELSAVAIAELFFTNIVRAFGIPCEIISDHDRRFVSTFW